MISYGIGPCFQTPLCICTMCYYRLYIFVGCGHSTFSEMPVRHCKDTRRKTRKRPKDLVQSQDEDTGFRGSRRCTDSQRTLLPEDNSEEGADTTISCSDTLKSLGFNNSIGVNKTQDMSLTPATNVPQPLNTNDRTVSPHSPSPTATQEVDNPSPHLPTTMTNTIEPCKDGRVHPLHTIRLECICSACEDERDKRLRVLYSSIREIKIDPARWHRKYQGNVSRKGNENQWPGVGWSVGVGAAVGEWWDRRREKDKDEIT